MNGVSLPSPIFPAITISELSAAASNLNLTGRLGRLEFARDLAQHLNQMEQNACTFVSAPQLMWALKALTLTEDEVVKQQLTTGTSGAKVPALPAPPSRPPPVAPFSPSLAQLSSSELFRTKRAAIEAIIAEQGFAPPVAQYIRAHALTLPAPLHSSSSTTSSSAAQSSSSSSSSTPTVTDSSLPPPVPPLNAHPPAHAKTVSEPPQLFDPIPPPVPAFPHALTIGHKSSRSLAPTTSTRRPVGGPVTPNSVKNIGRSNSLQTELDYEWSRRHIPKVHLKTVARRVDSKLKEEIEELEERRQGIVAKLLAMNIWQDENGNSKDKSKDRSSPSSKPAPSDVIATLSQHRFDLLRFTFELTELAEMEGRNIRFNSIGQAMASLKILYDRLSAEEIRKICEEKHIPSHVQAYLEARRSEITHSREDSKEDLERASTAAAAAVTATRSDRTVSQASPPLHHRSISLMEFVEVLESGNLLSKPVKMSPEQASWLLTDVGLDLAEVSIDDLISMQQDGRLAQSFQTPKQVVHALATLYTDHDESEITEVCRRVGLNERIRTYLIEAQRCSLPLSVGLESNLHRSNLLSGGGKRSRVERVARTKTLRAKCVEFELQLDEGLEEIDEDEHAISTHQPRPLYTLYSSDRSVLLARDRRAHPLPTVELSQLVDAVNSSNLVSELITEHQLAQLISELNLHLDQSDGVDIDLHDIEHFKGCQFKDTKQLLQALQLLNIQTSLDEFDASCRRAGFDSKVVGILEHSSLSHASARMLEFGSNRTSAAAKYALLEGDVRIMDFEELDGFSITEDEVQLEYGSPTNGVSSARQRPRYASFETRLEDGMNGEDDLATGMTLEQFTARLEASMLIATPPDGSHLTPSNVGHILARMNLTLAQLDSNLLEEDLRAMEVQGGLRFKSARSLVQALALLQSNITDDDAFYARLESEHFSPSIVEFLMQLHRSPTRTAKQQVVRSRRTASRQIPLQAVRAVMRSQIMEEVDTGIDEHMVEEIATTTSMSFVKLLHHSEILDSNALVEESEVSSLLLTSTVEQLPEYCVDSDIRSLSCAGIRFAHPKQVVRVIELLHQADDPSADELMIELPSSMPRETKARHVEFMLQHRALHLQTLGAELKIQPYTGRPRHLNHQHQPKQMRQLHEEEFGYLAEDVDSHPTISEDGATQHIRVVRDLSKLLVESNLVDPSEVTEERLLQTCVEMKFQLDESNFAEAELLIDSLRRGNKSGHKVNPRHIVLALQLVDESDSHAGVLESPKRLKSLPPQYAEFVQKRSDRSAQIHAAMIHRRALKPAKKPEPKSIVTFHQLEDMVGEIEWNETNVFADKSDSDMRKSAALRSYCTEMELDLSQVTLDELEVVTNASRRGSIKGPKQAVQVLKLLQYDPSGMISKDQLVAELDRLESNTATNESAARKRQTVRMLFEVEEELSLHIEESPEMVSVNHQSTSRLPPPLPSVTNISSPQIHASPSPEPPPFPKHLIRHSSSLESSISPPVPAYPYGLKPPISTSHHVRFHSHEVELTPEKQYEGLVEHILELGLAKSP